MSALPSAGRVDPDATTPLRDYLRVLRRRVWLVVLATVALAVAAGAFSQLQTAKYEASSEVLLSSVDLAANLAGIANGSPAQQPDRIVATQAGLTRVPTLVARVIRAAGVGDLTVERFLAQTSVAPEPNTDILRFTVDAATPAAATRLATAYAWQYTAYRRQLDTAPVERARIDLEKRIADLVSSGSKDAALIASLKANDQKLRTVTALETANATVVRSGSDAVQVAPRTSRNVMLGLAFGIVLGVGLAFLLENFDPRVREADEVAARLDLPLLAVLAHRSGAEMHALALQADPAGAEAEAFRLLRRRLELATLDEPAQTFMVTSALRDEGKSVTVANLAIAFARGGRHVVLVDADLRAPTLHDVLDVRSEPGLTDVVLGAAKLDAALVQIVVPALDGAEEAAPARNGKRAATNGHKSAGILEVLPAGALPASPGEFLEAAAFQRQLAALSARADIVLFDSPALLSVDDGIALSANVDAVIVVVRDAARRAALTELGRALKACRARTLGVVVNASASVPAYVGAYGADSSLGFGYRAEQAGVIARYTARHARSFAVRGSRIAARGSGVAAVRVKNAAVVSARRARTTRVHVPQPGVRSEKVIRGARSAAARAKSAATRVKNAVPPSSSSW